MPLLTAQTNPARLSAAIRALEAMGHDFPVPLFRAVLADQLALAVLAPRESLPLATLDPIRFRRPLVVLLGGDGAALDGSLDCGPEGWRQSRRLLAWSRWTILHATGGERWHYEMAVDAARHLGRVLIAECGSATLPGWLALKAEVRPTGAGIVIQCRPGDVHPRQPARAEGMA